MDLRNDADEIPDRLPDGFFDSSSKPQNSIEVEEREEEEDEEWLAFERDILAEPSTSSRATISGQEHIYDPDAEEQLPPENATMKGTAEEEKETEEEKRDREEKEELMARIEEYFSLPRIASFYD